MSIAELPIFIDCARIAAFCRDRGIAGRAAHKISLRSLARYCGGCGIALATDMMQLIMTCFGTVEKMLKEHKQPPNR